MTPVSGSAATRAPNVDPQVVNDRHSIGVSGETIGHVGAALSFAGGVAVAERFGAYAVSASGYAINGLGKLLGTFPIITGALVGVASFIDLDRWLEKKLVEPLRVNGSRMTVLARFGVRAASALAGAGIGWGAEALSTAVAPTLIGFGVAALGVAALPEWVVAAAAGTLAYGAYRLVRAVVRHGRGHPASARP